MKHEDKKIVKNEKLKTNNQEDSLQSILEDVKKVQEEKINEENISELEKKIEELEAKNKELSEIAKKAQLDYLNLKADFDMFHRQTKEANKNMEVDSLISMVKKFLPFIEDLRKSLEHV
jgi:molecular chaperone GrpE (heat shock protein)